MNGELTTEVAERLDVEIARPLRSARLVAMAFGLFSYAAFAAVYFSRPNKPLMSVGQFRFTVDALLEWVFTVMALPAIGMAYFFGIRHHEENPDFAVPDSVVDLLFLAAITWLAVGNGIHLTAKLNEQMLSRLNDGHWLVIRNNFHWIRQELGHVLPQIGWQVLFVALMLGQLKRPYRGSKPKVAVPYFGILFGSLFAHGAIAGACTHVGFVLTAVSLFAFLYLGHESKLLPGELPILTFFLFSQVTFLLLMMGYWSVMHFGLV